MKAILYFIISIITIFSLTLLFDKLLQINGFNIQITILISVFTFLIKDKIELDKILYSLLSINMIAILLQIFSNSVIKSFNSVFFKKLGFSLFSTFLILFLISLLFLTKYFKLSDKTKNISLIILNLSLILLSFFVFKTILYYSYLLYFSILFIVSYTIKLFINKSPKKIPSILTLSTLMFLFVVSLFATETNNNVANHLNRASNNKALKRFNVNEKQENKVKLLNPDNTKITNNEPKDKIKKNITKKKKKKNILLITIDALTPFHMGLYGYKRKTTPNLTKFAKQALLFNKAFTQGPNTRPAVASLITSKYVTEIYWTDKKRFIPLKQENLTFAEILKAEGYNTYGVLTHSYFLKRFGYNQGFEHWDTSLISTDPKIAFGQETAHKLYDKFRNIVKVMKKDEPNFIWLHFFDPHDNYVLRKEAKIYGNKTVDIYDNEINYTDLYLGKLFKFLKEKKLMDDFIIIITADHGEAFGSHGYVKHGRSVYNDQMWVPLIIKFPKVKPQIIEHEVAHIDIIPTVLDYLKINKYNDKLSGSSILEKIKNNNFPPIYTLLFKKGKNKYSIAYKGYKLNYFENQDIKKLFDLRNDMNEMHDISNEHPEIMYNLWNKLSKWIKKENRIYKKRNK